MKKLCLAWIVGFVAACCGAATVYNDTTGDIDVGLANGGGTLDILSMEVSHTATDVIFTLTLNGDVGTTDWGKFLVGIATGGAGTTSGNGWGRPINMDSPIGGMDYWIGTWVDSGGGAQFWSYNGTAWEGPEALAGFAFAGGAQSELTMTVAKAELGLSDGDTFYFDAYSSGGGGTDTAIDALSNPNVSVTSWGESYTSRTNDTGLSSYSLTSTRVALYDFYLREEGGQMRVCWQTASEEGTVGFDLFRWDGKAWTKMNDGLIAASGPMGGSYWVDDALANSDDTFRYKLVEYETDGGVREYGPFEVAASNPRLENLAVGPEGVVLRWLSREGDVYAVQKALGVAEFSAIATNLPATPTVNAYTDRTERANGAFYRVVVE